MAYEIKGRVYSVSQSKQISEKFSKREIVIQHGDKYPQWSSFEATNDRQSLLDGINPGDTVTIWFDPSGREPKGDRHFNSLRIWKIQRDSAGQSAPSGGGFGDQDSIPF